MAAPGRDDDGRPHPVAGMHIDGAWAVALGAPARVNCGNSLCYHVVRHQTRGLDELSLSGALGVTEDIVGDMAAPKQDAAPTETALRHECGWTDRSG
jgi:hypothetical protein